MIFQKWFWAFKTAPLHLWMRKMDSWQNSTSTWLSKNFLNFFFRRKKIFFEKSILKKKNWKFDFEKYFCSFSKNIFFYEKKSWENFWITMSMWNFVRNPFFAFINTTEQFWRSKTVSENIRNFWFFEIPPTSPVAFSISSVANSKIKNSGRGGQAHLSFTKKIKSFRALSSAGGDSNHRREMTLSAVGIPGFMCSPSWANPCTFACHLKLSWRSASFYFYCIKKGIIVSYPGVLF